MFDAAAAAAATNIYVYIDMENFEDLTESRVSVQSGQAAILYLPPIESIPLPSVTWQDEEQSLIYNIKYAISLTNQLIILSADENDQKSYRARAINTQIGKEENSAFIHLNVSASGDTYNEFGPEIIIPPETKKIIRGEQNAELQCIANARPLHELETLWFKDGISIDNSGILYTLNDPWNRTLTLLSVNLTHTGEYSCTVKLRSGGFPTVTSTAVITVLEPPSFNTQFRPETLGDYGELVNLPCDVIGVPVPHVTWFRNAEAIDLSSDR